MISRMCFLNARILTRVYLRNAGKKKPNKIKCRKGLRHDCVKGDSLSFVSNAGLLPSFVMNVKNSGYTCMATYGRRDWSTL